MAPIGVVTYGHGTQAYWQVLASLFPAALVGIGFTARYLGTLGRSIKLLERLTGQIIGLNSVKTIYSVLWQVITVATLLSYGIGILSCYVGEARTLRTLQRGHATEADSVIAHKCISYIGDSLIAYVILGVLTAGGEYFLRERESPNFWNFGPNADPTLGE